MHLANIFDDTRSFVLSGNKATQTAATAAAAAPKKEFTAAEQNACSLDAMMNGGECEACQ
ncbi:MAG: hypothetical protein NWT08_12230 [Akkermansiaceae bacterium]|nr:hypothetical protein [Akkermansiaceae bacterium]MDP4848103.1 hypothetical protein [Akkermansiaceae bacterium]